MQFVIVKKDGTSTQPMSQDRVMAYMVNVVGKDKATRLSNLQSSLNAVADGKGKPTSGFAGKNAGSLSFCFRGQKVLHCSSGKAGSGESTTVFFFNQGNKAHIIALGRHSDDHKGKPAYAIDIYGQTGDLNFDSKCVIRLAEKPK